MEIHSFILNIENIMKDIYLIEKDMIIQKEKALHTKDRTKILLKMNQETRLINIYTF